MSDSFGKYLENLREEVKREPKNDLERGFQAAVVIIYAKYKNNNPEPIQEENQDMAS